MEEGTGPSVPSSAVINALQIKGVDLTTNNTTTEIGGKRNRALRSLTGMQVGGGTFPMPLQTPQQAEPLYRLGARQKRQSPRLGTCLPKPATL